VLVGTISDGGIRRGFLRGLQICSSIESVVHRDALVVTQEIGENLITQLMVANKIHQIPVIDDERRVVGLHLWDDIECPSQRNNSLVIMAGGQGARLRPHTEPCPNPIVACSGKANFGVHNTKCQIGGV